MGFWPLQFAGKHSRRQHVLSTGFCVCKFYQKDRPPFICEQLTVNVKFIASFNVQKQIDTTAGSINLMTNFATLL